MLPPEILTDLKLLEEAASKCDRRSCFYRIKKYLEELAQQPITQDKSSAGATTEQICPEF